MTPGRPTVLFVCARNAGKSPMAAGLMALRAGDAVEVGSAGTQPGGAVNPLSAAALAEVGVDIGRHVPRAVTPELLRAADVVVVLGREAQVDAPPGTAVETWDTDEPSRRGIEGLERMRLVRDDIARHVDELCGRLGVGGPAVSS